MLFKWFASFLISSLCTRLVIIFSKRLKYFQPISTYLVHQHKKGIPTLGGLAIFLGFMIVRLFNSFLGLNKEMHFIYYASSICFLIGLVDDVNKIKTGRNAGKSKLWKFLILLLLLLPYFLFTTRDIFIGIKYVSIIIFSCATANIVDGLDGLLPLTVLPILICLGTDTSISLAGSILGFLYFNLKPARVFMGDCGSMFIGALIACTILNLETENGVIFMFVVPILQIASVGLKLFLRQAELPHKFFIAPLHHDLERRIGESMTTIILVSINACIVFYTAHRLVI